MHQIGNHAYIILNDWRGMYETSNRLKPNRYSGGVIVVIDVSDERNPVIKKRVQIPGEIQASRLSRVEDTATLYVLAEEVEFGIKIRSFSLSENGALEQRNQINLGGNTQVLHATDDRLIIAQESTTHGGGDVTLVDISKHDGTMIAGNPIQIEGRVLKKTDLDIRGEILRVVSSPNAYSNSDFNQVETFDVSDIFNAQKIDHKNFGEDQDLRATIFLESSAFFVTHQNNQGPFHSFSISNKGLLTKESEFQVSGVNVWFQPVANKTRLIGIGINDENRTQSSAVSLYNIEDLKSAEPLIARAELPFQSGWNPANWDERAFSILEDVTNIAGPMGETETGMILLPFSGRDGQTYKSGVQIFTFSETSITRRGIMTEDTLIGRAFAADSQKKLSGNLSHQELSLFDTSVPDSPTEKSRLTLATNYTDVLFFVDYAIRRISPLDYWWGYQGDGPRHDRLQIVAKGDSLDTAKTLAEIEIPEYSSLYQKDHTLFVISTNRWRVGEERSVSSWNFTDPLNPVLTNTFDGSQLPRGVVFSGTGSVQVVGDALVFSEYELSRNLFERTTPKRPKFARKISIPAHKIPQVKSNVIVSKHLRKKLRKRPIPMTRSIIGLS